MIWGLTNFLPRRWVRALGTRSARPVRRTRHEFAFQCTSTLHVERLVDGFVGDSHGLVIGKIDPEPLLRFARGSTSLPTVDPFVAHDGDRPTAPGVLAPTRHRDGR